MTIPRSRVAAALTMAAVAAPSAGLLAPAAIAATTTGKPKAGQSCKKAKKAPAGWKCVKNAKGKYVLKKR